MTVVLTEKEREKTIDQIIDLLVELGFWELTEETATDPPLCSTIPLIFEIPEVVK